LDLANKNQWREYIVGSVDKSSAIFLAQYSGMTVEDLTNLRRGLRGVNAEFQVVKNTIAKKALDGKPQAVAAEWLKGQTGIVFAYGDPAAAAKVLSDEAKKNEKLKVLGGAMGADKLTAKNIALLASLPSREVLISKIIGSMVAPHRGLLGVMQGVPRAMVSVLNQIKEQKAAG
jgi:large subunit ribosomal protein L10